MAIPIKSIKTVTTQTDVGFTPHDCRRSFATIEEAVNLPMSIRRLKNPCHQQRCNRRLYRHRRRNVVRSNQQGG